jgi:hypothetical protein
MPRGLLPAFRSADGRSLARALAALMIVSAVLAGLAGGSAAATDGIAHCIPASDQPGLPAGHDGLTCCPGLTGGSPLAPPPAAPGINIARSAGIAFVSIPRDLWIPESPVAPSDRPRGPPASA